MNEKISADKFKAECLQIMEKARKTNRKITISNLGNVSEKLS